MPLETSSPASAPAPAIATDALAGLSPADREVAARSLERTGKFSADQIAAVKSPTPAAPKPGENLSPSATPAPSIAPDNRILPQGAATKWVSQFIADHAGNPELIQGVKDAFQADYGVAYDSAVQSAEDAAYGIPADESGYDVRVNGNPALDPAASPETIANVNAGFARMANAMRLPSRIAQSFGENVLSAADRWLSAPDESTRETLSLQTKAQVASWLGFRSWEDGLPQLREAAQAVVSKLSADDRAALLEIGAFEDSRVLLQIINQGRLLLARQS